MVLIKGTYIARADVSDLDHRYVFLISPDDLELMSLPSVRPYTNPRAPLRQEHLDHVERLAAASGEDLVRQMMGSGNTAADIQTGMLSERGVVVRLPFHPESPKLRPGTDVMPGRLPYMEDDSQVGRDFWILIRGPWRTPEVHSHAGWRDAESSLYHALGIYPVLKPSEIREQLQALDSMPWHLHRNPGIPSLSTVMLDFLEEHPPAVQRTLLDTWWRSWGVAVSMPLVHGVLERGHRLYKRGPGAVRLADFYTAYARTTVRSHRKWSDGTDWEMPLPHGEREYAPEQPLQGTLVDMSNPLEYGSPGALFPLAMLDCPYGFVGPASSKGVTDTRTGAGVRGRLPWWVCDLLARSVYGASACTEQRASALVYDAVRNLELRNRHAFEERNEDGSPRRVVPGEMSFDFDVRGPSPAGSTVFERNLLERAVVRRRSDLEGAIERDPLTPRRLVHLTGTEVVNPYVAIAGYLGVAMDPVESLQDAKSRWEAVERVVAPVRHPSTQGGVEVRYGLKERVLASRHALQAILQQEHEFGGTPFLTVEPPLRLDDPRWHDTQPPGGRMLCTPSQASAFLQMERWRISVITGEAGAGKTALYQEICRAALELSPQSPSGRVILIVLTPTNIATAKVLEALRRQTSDITLLGARSAEVKADADLFASTADATCCVGTVDSYLRKFEYDEEFQRALLSNHVILVFEEAQTLSTEAFTDVLSAFRAQMSVPADPNEWFHLSDNLLRLLILGDEMQLRPMEPGDLLLDAMSALPVTRLTDQMRYDGELAGLFGSLRVGMQDEGERKAAATAIVRAAEQPDPQSMCRVVLIDDLPAVETVPTLESPFWLDFRLQLEDRVRQALFRELLDWSRTELSPVSRPVSCPRLHTRQTRDEQRMALEDYTAFSRAILQPRLPYVVITMVRTPCSSNPRLDMRAHYMSSSVRVNGWIHDALRGRLADPDPQYMGITRPDRPVQEIGDDLVRYLPRSARYVNEPARQANWEVIHRELSSHRDRRTELRQFISDYRPNNLCLAPHWPYIVTTTDFRGFGVVKGERVRYVRTTRKKSRQLYLFVSDNGAELELPPHYCTSSYLSYGWATNVHQVMGGESPLVIVIWVDGVNPYGITQEWDQIRPRRDGHRIVPVLEAIPPRPGASRYPVLDDPFDLHALYTAVTRTQAKPELATHVEGRHVVQQGRGRCVLIAGKHALRRFLTLESIPRATAMEGLLWETLVEAQGNG